MSLGVKELIKLASDKCNSFFIFFFQLAINAEISKNFENAFITLSRIVTFFYTLRCDCIEYFNYKLFFEWKVYKVANIIGQFSILGFEFQEVYKLYRNFTRPSWLILNLEPSKMPKKIITSRLFVSIEFSFGTVHK